MSAETRVILKLSCAGNGSRVPRCPRIRATPTRSSSVSKGSIKECSSQASIHCTSPEGERAQTLFSVPISSPSSRQPMTCASNCSGCSAGSTKATAGLLPCCSISRASSGRTSSLSTFNLPCCFCRRTSTVLRGAACATPLVSARGCTAEVKGLDICLGCGLGRGGGSCTQRSTDNSGKPSFLRLVVIVPFTGFTVGPFWFAGFNKLRSMSGK
mmetsp:Transcript_6197/g.11524  ORF Transcript_6197/g.11524 Transcript_6197/m.11524 type:complete len:213 (-) Transcript_6197:960-1598(-)